MISVYEFCDIYLIVGDEKVRDFLALEAEKN